MVTRGESPPPSSGADKWKLIHYYEDGRDELYDLEKDLSEENDLSGQYPDRVREMNQELFSIPGRCRSQVPWDDPEYREELEMQYLEKSGMSSGQRLKKQRLHYLSEDFDPGNMLVGQ